MCVMCDFLVPRYGYCKKEVAWVLQGIRQRGEMDFWNTLILVLALGAFWAKLLGAVLPTFWRSRNSCVFCPAGSAKN